MYRFRTTLKCASRGFTLLELMTAVAVMAVLLAVAIPSFTDMIRANQIAAESNSVMSALALARSESIKRGVRVSVCAADTSVNPPTDCSTTPSWNSGWIVFADDFGAAGTIDDSDFPIQFWPAIANGVNVASNEAITFTRSGRAEFARTFTVTKPGCGQGQRRDITIDLSGRVSLARSNCS